MAKISGTLFLLCDQNMISRLSISQVNLFLLRKQRLLVQESCEDIPRLVQEIGGLHATSPTTPYLSLFARCQAFQKADLDAHLYRWNTLAKLRCVRKTVYILPRELLPVAFRATRALVEKESRRFLHQPVQILHQFLQFCRLQSLHVSFRICITG